MKQPRIFSDWMTRTQATWRPARRYARKFLRSQYGVSVLALTLIVGFLVLPPLAILAFEAGRANLAKQQLTNAIDSASLAAAATLASQDDSNPTVVHQNAIQAALKIFRRNAVISTPLTNSQVATAPNQTPPLGEGRVFFEFLNPVTQAVEPLDSAKGKIVRGFADVTLETAFGKYLGLGPLTLHSQGRAAVPELDLVICFDISGSIDDQTPVTLVRRQNGPGGVLLHTAVRNGIIRDICNAPPTGTGANATPPQGLSSYNATGFSFSENNVAEGLRSGGVYPEAGRPPGNPPAPTVAPAPVGTRIFTDMVVNIDGNPSFGGATIDGFSFPDVPTLVEASRGNLEDLGVFSSSKANTVVTVAPRAGYKAAYDKAARLHAQPIHDAREATKLFLQILNNNTHAHFGFVAFDHMVGANENTVETRRDIDDSAPYGASVGFPVPLVKLDRASAVTHFDEALAAVDRTQAKGATNIGAAVLKAVELLQSDGRVDAVKAIVLFTDGQPTAAGPLSGDPFANARLAAVRARDAGIPVYTIGLAQTPAVVPGQTAILNDTNSNPSNGGIAAISGQGATFNIVNNSQQLRSTFEKIARHLVQLVQGSTAQ